MNRLINALGFQVGWWACVASVGLGLEIPALLFCTALVCAHLTLSDKRTTEIRLAAIVWLLGVVMDSLLQYFSVIHFYGWAFGPLSPFWLWMLWVLFGMTLNTSLDFLQHKSLALAAVAGLILGPLTYLAGAKLGAAAFDGTLTHTTMLALSWLLVMPATVYLAKLISNRPQGLP